MAIFVRIPADPLPNEESASNTPLDDYRVTMERVEELAGVVFKL